MKERSLEVTKEKWPELQGFLRQKDSLGVGPGFSQEKKKKDACNGHSKTKPKCPPVKPWRLKQEESMVIQ